MTGASRQHDAAPVSSGEQADSWAIPTSGLQQPATTRSPQLLDEEVSHPFLAVLQKSSQTLSPSSLAAGVLRDQGQPGLYVDSRAAMPHAAPVAWSSIPKEARTDNEYPCQGEDSDAAELLAKWERAREEEEAQHLRQQHRQQHAAATATAAWHREPRQRRASVVLRASPDTAAEISRQPAGGGHVEGRQEVSEQTSHAKPAM
jgi:hypothetical protein